jgi:hypothetical protein
MTLMSARLWTLDRFALEVKCAPLPQTAFHATILVYEAAQSIPALGNLPTPVWALFLAQPDNT